MILPEDKTFLYLVSDNKTNSNENIVMAYIQRVLLFQTRQVSVLSVASKKYSVREDISLVQACEHNSTGKNKHDFSQKISKVEWMGLITGCAPVIENGTDGQKMGIEWYATDSQNLFFSLPTHSNHCSNLIDFCESI